MNKNIIYSGNCLDIMPKKIEKESIDVIATDPPYCIGTTSNGHKGTWLDNNLIQPFFRDLFNEYVRVIRNNRQIIGIEINEKNFSIARKRIKNEAGIFYKNDVIFEDKELACHIKQKNHVIV